MLDGVHQIQTYSQNRNSSDFYADRQFQDAVVRNFEILGEASRRLLEAMPDAPAVFPKIPFAAIYAMRNQLSHGYFIIDLDTVWKAVERDIPELRNELEAALMELNRIGTS